MTILVIGGASFIGSNFLMHLLKQGSILHIIRHLLTSRTLGKHRSGSYVPVWQHLIKLLLMKRR